MWEKLTLKLRERVKLLEQELQAKDDLLSEKVAVKLPTQPEGFKLFGNSRVEVLEKELVKSKQAVMAHQTHGAFLGMEVHLYDFLCNNSSSLVLKKR